MTLTVDQVYSVRFGPKLPLSNVLQDNIGKLRITAVPFKPAYRPQPKFHKKPNHSSDNWRENALVDSVRKVKERDDPEYADVFGALNKISTKTFDKLSDQIITNIEKRDEMFRLRVTTLLFDLAITQPGYGTLMADCAKKLTDKIPDIKDDLVVQTEMFPKLYNMTETVTCPTLDDSSYSDKIVEWMKIKNKRRGYAKFVTLLFVRELLDETKVSDCLKTIIDDLTETTKQPNTEQTVENTSQLVDFLYETAKALPTTANILKSLIKDFVTTLLGLPRPELPSLNIRSRFKLEDTLKCVQ